MKIIFVSFLFFGVFSKKIESAPARFDGVVDGPFSTSLIRTQLGFTGKNARQQRQLINIGEWIQNTPWLPIEINVPDFFGNIANGFASFGNYIQQLPIFQQWFSPQTPRPMRYYLLVPAKNTANEQQAISSPQHFVTFDGFPPYP